jgi:hypothetical protein
MTGSLIAAFDAGCVGDAFTYAIPPADAGNDQGNCCPGCPPCGTPDPDSSTPAPDGGSPDTGMSNPDTGSPGTDSGTDSGDPPDSGCTVCPDAGMDSGSMDSGSMDSGTDSGSMDSGTDSGVDAGLDGSSEGGLDGGGDAGDAGCVSLTTTCAGNQPLICQSGSWVTNGGLCDYACNSGACLCNDPYVADGGTGRFKPVFGGLEDTSTSETWYTSSFWATTAAYEPNAQTFCTAKGARLPHESELMAIIAQQDNNVFCSGSSFDADSQFQSTFSMTGDWYWTDTAPSGWPTHHECVHFGLGKIGDADGVCSPLPPAPDKCYTLCVSP